MRPRELVAGNCYFHVGFSDLSMQLPRIQTLVYHSVVEDDDGIRHWLFQDPPSLTPPGAEEASDASTSFYGFTDDQLSRILDFPALSRALAEVAVDHPLHPFEPGRRADVDAPALADLETHVKRFLGSTEYPYLAIGVLFTGHGISISRVRGGALHADYFFNHRQVPEQESKVREWFAAQGIAASEDYLADRGRTRILSYPIASAPNEVVALCREMILEVFGLQHDDRITYSFGQPNGPE